MVLPSILPDNTYAVGDIHGCRKTLQTLIESLPLNNNSVLIFLGDYIDRGPDTKGVIDYLIQLKTKYECHFLIGNHEQLLLDYIQHDDFKNWLPNGAIKTMESYGFKNGYFDLPENHLLFLKSCHYYIDSPDFLFVHGGVRPEQSIRENISRFSKFDMLWERDHLKAEKLNWEKTVVCGHTPRQFPLIKEKLISIDTGCVYKDSMGMGNLTAVQLPSAKIFQTAYCE